MGVYRFEDLRVWQAARRQCHRVGELVKRPEFRRDWALSDQMNAAAISVMFNISEGFLRRRDAETLQFLRYAFASNGELKAGYYAAEDRKYITSEEPFPQAPGAFCTVSPAPVAPPSTVLRLLKPPKLNHPPWPSSRV